MVCGRYISHVELKKHRNKTLKLGIASARLTTEIVSLTPPAINLPRPVSSLFSLPQNITPAQPDQAQAVSSTSSHNATSSHPAHPKKTKSGSIHIDHHLLKLRQIQGLFKNSAASDVVSQVEQHSLVFSRSPSQPSQSVTDDDGDFTLNKTAAPNSKIVVHEEWLIETQGYITECLKMGKWRHSQATSTSARTLARVLLTHSEKELAVIANFKQKAWGRQHAAAAAAGSGAVDTGKSIPSPSTKYLKCLFQPNMY